MGRGTLHWSRQNSCIKVYNKLLQALKENVLVIDFAITATEPCKAPGHCEDSATHTFQFGDVEYLICCNHAEEAFQRILSGETIEQVMFEFYREPEEELQLA